MREDASSCSLLALEAGCTTGSRNDSDAVRIGLAEDPADPSLSSRRQALPFSAAIATVV